MAKTERFPGARSAAIQVRVEARKPSIGINGAGYKEAVKGSGLRLDGRAGARATGSRRSIAAEERCAGGRP